MAYVPLHRYGYTPLMRAAIDRTNDNRTSKGRAYEVTLLIEQRADLNMQHTDE
jgi:hypothetical protein